MLILEDFTNTWNYTFIAVALFSIAIGTFITIRKMKKEEMDQRREKRNEQNDQENNTN